MSLPAGLSVATATLALDQALKAWARLGGMAENGYAPLTDFGGLGLGATLVYNPGIVFGMVLPDADRRLLVIVLAATIASVVLVRMIRSRRIVLNLARGAVVGGALSNLVDRVRVGAVVDYLVVHTGAQVRLVFNLADVAIIGGALLLFGAAAAYALASGRTA
ncbi:signal peptidase II [Roseomonas rosulenta]|uniref:signal peptidase II n=1 Tax=Roseomonas rosulenta TaxID=2748667 RepID=UPI0018DF8235|nr:signal peptidase II [Roseomonas rosulenta]